MENCNNTPSNDQNLVVYILELENNKWYIGKTHNPTFRINDHFASNGSEWTKTHKPIKLTELIKNCDDYDEDKYTIKYMKEKGIDNVRGGSFCALNLNDMNIGTIKQMINGANNHCYKCGNIGHYANNCGVSDFCSKEILSNFEFFVKMNYKKTSNCNLKFKDLIFSFNQTTGTNIPCKWNDKYGNVCEQLNIQYVKIRHPKYPDSKGTCHVNLESLVYSTKSLLDDEILLCDSNVPTNITSNNITPILTQPQNAQLVQPVISTWGELFSVVSNFIGEKINNIIDGK